MGGAIGTIAGAALGSVIPGVGTALGATIGGAAGSMLGGSAQGRAGASAAGAAGSSISGAGQAGAQAAQFRPVGITTRFGSSNFGYDAAGNLTSAGYEVNPEIAAIRDRLLGTAGQYQYDISGQLTPLSSAAQGLFGLGSRLLPTDITRTASPEALALQQRYQQAATALAPTDLSMAASPEAMALSQQLRGLSQQVTPTSYDPTAAAQQYFEQQRALLEPSRQAQLSQTRSRLFGTGRGGLGVTTATGGAPTSPELQAYYNAIAQQDAALAAQSTDVARQRLAQDIALGTQLGGTALSTQQQAEEIARQRTLGNLQASLGLGAQALSTGVAGEELARQRFAQDLGLGTGLFTTGGQLLGQVPALQTAYLSPLQSQIGLAGSLEALGQTPLDLSAQLAGRQASAGALSGQIGLLGARSAAPYQVEQQSYSPMGQILGASAGPAAGSLQQLGGRIGGWFGDLIGLQPTPGQTSTGLYTFD